MNSHPVVIAEASIHKALEATSEEPIVRLKLDKPLHWDWELTTSADTLPIIQLLNKDGKVLIETSGRTAQRARGSFKTGVETLEKFPKEIVEQPSSSCSAEGQSPICTSPVQKPLGNRNFDGFSSKFGGCHFTYRPKKSKSDVTIDTRKEGKGKKRHSTGVEEPGRTVRRSETAPKRYSTGDFLRQQILEDLLNQDDPGKSPEQLALDQCNRVKAYLFKNSVSQQETRSNDKENIQIEQTKLAELAELKNYLKNKKSENRSNSRNYRPRKIRSETNVENIEESWKRKFNKRTSSSFTKENTEINGNLERHKYYRKTKSDVFLGLASASEDLGNPPMGGLCQDNVQKSWREYKERKRLEKLNRERQREKQKENLFGNHADFHCSPPDSRPGTALQENYLLLDKSKKNQQVIVARVQVNGAQEVSNLSQDFGYNSIKEDTFDNYKEYTYSRSNVKKSNTFKIIDGSEENQEANKSEKSEKQSFGNKKIDRCSLIDKSNEDIAKDYFRRVYELLKQKQLEASGISQGQSSATLEDSSSSNYAGEMQRKKYRRRKRDKSPESKKRLFFFSSLPLLLFVCSR